MKRPASTIGLSSVLGAALVLAAALGGLLISSYLGTPAQTGEIGRITGKYSIERPGATTDAPALASQVGASADEGAGEVEPLSERSFDFAVAGLFLGLTLLLVRELGRRKRNEAELARQRDDLARMNRRLVESETALAEHTALLDRTLEHTRHGIVVIDRDYRVRLINPRAAEIMGLPVTSLAPEITFADFVAHGWERYHIGNPEMSRAEFERRLYDLASPSLHQGRLPDGRIFEIENVPLPDGGAIRTTTEITAHVRTEQKLRAAMEAAETAMRSRSAFLATMSHEIRTPMNGVIGLAGLLGETTLDATQRTYLATLRRSADHLLLLLNDVLDFSKLDAGRVQLDVEPFGLDDTMENVLAMLSPQAMAKGLEIRSTIAHDVPRWLVGDAGRISQVLLNLGSNAVKFTERGSVALAVSRVRDVAGGVELRFEIADTGIGIDAASIPKLFVEFSQIDGSITRRYGGTGLGLAISNRLVALMGGRITVDSVPRRGSVFAFTAVMPIDKNPPRDAAPAAGANLAELQGDRGVRVLLAEDNLTNQLVARSILENQGCRVEVVGTGGEAVAAVREREYDIVLMDLMMPEMGGIEATILIRQLDAPHGKVPIVAMTANAFTSDRDACLAAGMNGFIAKPATAAKLVAAIATALGSMPAAPPVAPPPPALSGGELDDPLLTLLETDCEGALPELLTMFLNESGKRLAHIRAIVGGADGDLLREAHTLKGGAYSFGCAQLGVVAAELEAAVATRSPAVAEHLDSVERAYRSATVALRRRYPSIGSVETP